MLASIRSWMFRYRSYTPIPFLLVMLLWARPTLTSMSLGFLVVVLGESIRFWGVSIAGAETRTTGRVGGSFLITNGPFAYVRNPLYVGNMLMYCGIGVMSMAVFPWLLIGAACWFYLQYVLIVQEEEGYLRERFGTEYGDYVREVPRFLPRLTPYRPASLPAKMVDVRAGLESERRTLQAIGLTMMLIVMVYFLR